MGKEPTSRINPRSEEGLRCMSLSEWLGCALSKKPSPREHPKDPTSRPRGHQTLRNRTMSSHGRRTPSTPKMNTFQKPTTHKRTKTACNQQHTTQPTSTAASYRCSLMNYIYLQKCPPQCKKCSSPTTRHHSTPKSPASPESASRDPPDTAGAQKKP